MSKDIHSTVNFQENDGLMITGHICALDRGRRAVQMIPSFYHSSNESECEIDFSVQTEKRVIPIEAKAEENVKGKSLKTYIDEHPVLKGLRVSMKNYIDQDWMENLPLYAIEGYLRAEGIPVPEQGE